MKWAEYRSAMERKAIKIDNMATEDAYFMATHMPFSQLEVYDSGRTDNSADLMDEDEVFEKLIYNEDNAHRMIIVRGDNGTGKTHLIRYWKAKFERSPSTIYDPGKEQIVFIRRLNNSVRGVFSQLVQQKAIKDPEIERKLRKFIDSTDSKDEDAFKTDILFAYIAAVSNDKSNKVYKEVICRDIASFLSDSRVKEFLLREEGPINRCYNVITAPSNQVLKTTSVFEDDDFNVNKILRAVMKQGDPQASLFATTLKSDDTEITRLVNYLNKFTGEVVQRCADISSESTKSMFKKLRSDLKQQGKNLTLFIEDFTGFTGIDSELITALAPEAGGEYDDLCRVTSVIGITNDYYDQFRDNFTDRVTHQVSVTDRSFGSSEFLINMAGRYLNAIYCPEEELQSWYQSGADLKDIPINKFEPPCEWDSVKIGDKETTLYPFNKRSLLLLYENLPTKSPRMFLRNVIREQLKEYFDGKEYGDEWAFPTNRANIDMRVSQHGSAIDRLEQFSIQDRNRLKSVFAIWADGSASGVKDSQGIKFGGINKKFLDDIGLSSFKGIGEIIDLTTGGNVDLEPENPSDEHEDQPEQPEMQTKPAVISAATKSYLRFKEDITNWFTRNEELKYHADYRKYLKNFIAGTANQSGAISWQDIGVPAYIADQRLADLSSYYIEGQPNSSNLDKVIVSVERNAEGRDALHALIEMEYAGGWDFEGSEYYQQCLITWLERNRSEIIKRVTLSDSINDQLPVIDWCLTLQYLKAKILGYDVNLSDTYSALSILFSDIKKKDGFKRETREWNDLVHFIQGKESEFFTAAQLLNKASKTTMGAIHVSGNEKAVPYYRADELIKAVDRLVACNWDIEDELPETTTSGNLIYNPAILLKALYPRIRKVVEAEHTQIQNVIKKIESYVGDITQNNLLDLIDAIQSLISTFSNNGIYNLEDIKTKFASAPIEISKRIIKQVEKLKDAEGEFTINQLAVYSGDSLSILSEFLRDLQKIEMYAEQEEARAKKQLSKITGSSDMPELTDAALESLGNLCDYLENMEVQNVTERDN